MATVLTRVNGYSAESERTYFTAAPSLEAKQAFDATTEARRITYEKIRPGMACGELDGTSSLAARPQKMAVEMMNRTQEAALSGDRRVKPDMNSHQTPHANVRNKSDADDSRVS